MKSIEAHRRLHNSGVSAFETSDASALLGTGSSHASRILERLCEAGQVVRLKRGVWAFPDRLDKLHLPEYLTAPLPCYISLQSALFYHGIVSQVPEIVYAVSPARTRRWITPLATVSVHHIAPAFFFGFESAGTGAAKMATPEKAILDYLYLSPAKSRLFSSLPELDLGGTFDMKKARRMLKEIPSARLRAILQGRLAALAARWGQPATPTWPRNAGVTRP